MLIALYPRRLYNTGTLLDPVALTPRYSITHNHWFFADPRSIQCAVNSDIHPFLFSEDGSILTLTNTIQLDLNDLAVNGASGRGPFSTGDSTEALARDTIRYHQRADTILSRNRECVHLPGEGQARPRAATPEQAPPSPPSEDRPTERIEPPAQQRCATMFAVPHGEYQ